MAVLHWVAKGLWRDKVSTFCWKTLKSNMAMPTERKFPVQLGGLLLLLHRSLLRLPLTKGYRPGTADQKCSFNTCRVFKNLRDFLKELKLCGELCIFFCHWEKKKSSFPLRFPLNFPRFLKGMASNLVQFFISAGPLWKAVLALLTTQLKSFRES